MSEVSALFPYRVRPGQEGILREVAELGRRGGALLVDAATGSGKTVATLAPLLEHAQAEDHRILYLVRTHSQEIQVLTEARAISHRLDQPVLALGLEGRQSRCFLLESVAEMKGATAEEYGKLCADRKRATQNSLDAGGILTPPEELPEGGAVDLTDLEGCPYYGRVLQSDMEALSERFTSKVSTPREFDEYSRSENLCAYELSKKLVQKARLVTAPYAFFFHPHIRESLLTWMGVGIDRVDLVVDEAHNLPDHLRELTTVSLPQESIRRARAEVLEHGDLPLPDGPTASRFFELAVAAVDELLAHAGEEEDAILPPHALEDALLAAVGGTSHRLDTWLGGLANWGETLREERRRARRLPRSWVHTVALTLLSWPQLESPTYVKVATRRPRRALEAYALDARSTAEPIRECHLSIHLSGTLAPLPEYRDALGLGDAAHLLSVPSHFPPENRRIFFDPELSTRYEEIQGDPGAVPRLADRLAEVLQSLPVKTAVFFPSFDLMERVLAAGLQSALPPRAVVESRRLSMGDLWRSVEVFKNDPSGTVLLGVTGGRIAEGIDFPDEELEAVVVVGIPFPRPTAKREALRAFWDRETGRGWEYAMEAPAQRAILQSIGRMIRSEHDRGIAVILDRRAPIFAAALPGLTPLGNLENTAREFYGRRAARGRRAASPPGVQNR
ncbi:MAG TPA: ATP-dependent DNA helicase [Thermoplasmata archaeon]|nr:ATP-dependent DNA helicase [Thermoplasmata archaeon]